jgi:hypothetical protein
MYLVYNCWDQIRPGESTISGSLMLDTADTEEKAKELKALYEARYIECKFKDPNTKTRFVYFWWDHPLNRTQNS